jgi:Fe-S oxidoreductase
MGGVLLFPGCMFRNHLSRFIPGYVHLLESLGVPVDLFDDDLCCGFVYRNAGRGDLFRERGKELVEKIAARDPATIVSLCPTCSRHFDKHLKRDCGLGADIATYHICRFVLERTGPGDLAPSVKLAGKTVGYQDPCWLGRRSGDYESPRRLMAKLGLTLTEGPESRRYADCCGYSGIVAEEHPQVAALVGGDRVRHFRQLGVDVVATCCPRCYIGLSTAAGERPQVLEFVELF